MNYKKIAGSLLILTTITGCGLIEETFLNEPSESNKSQKEIDNQSIAVDSSVEVLTPEEEQQIKEKEEHQKMLDELPDVSVSDWNLLLVNNSQLIDPNLDLPLTVLPNGYLIDERIKQEYENWLKKASEAGFEIVLVSSYRSIDLQQKKL